RKKSNSLLRMSSVIILLVPFYFTYSFGSKGNNEIVLFDLTYTLKVDFSKSSNIRVAWDHAHTVSTLQGIVNRYSPQLYLFFIENEGVNLDRYWWNNYRKPGKWLSGRD